MLPVALAAPLREALLAADFTYDAISELLGPEAHQALSRNETTPGVRRTAGGDAWAGLQDAPVPGKPAVSLGMPSVGRPAAAAAVSACAT